MQHHAIEPPAVLTDAKIRVVADAFIVLALAVREDEDCIPKFWIIHDWLKTLLAELGTLDLVPGAAAWIVFLDRIDEFVIVQDFGSWKEVLEMSSHREFANTRMAVDVDHIGWHYG